MWSDIPKKFKEILDADIATQALVTTVRIGLPVKNVTDASYPIVVIGRCSLTSSVLRATKKQDRISSWNCPVFIGLNSSMSDIEDASAYDDIDAIEQAVVAALLKDDDFNNENPYLDIELINSETDEDTMPPYLGQLYNFEVRKINTFGD